MSKDIIGISIGSKNTVLGTYKKGTFQVVLSETSSRTIPTVISYNNRERNFGEISQNKNRSNYKSTVIYPNRWLGIKSNSPIYKEESKYANLPPKIDTNNNLAFNIIFKGKKEFYTPECLMGLFFSKIKNVWLNQGINTTDVVVSIPDYSTVQERKSMIESVLIGGLNCTSLLNESSAIALAYGFQKLKEFQDDKPRLVAFIDLGHSQATIFFAEFTKKLVKVISVSTERFCGAREFDYLIAEQIAYEFQKRYGNDPLDSPKAKISLINAINKGRKTLTVNKDITISIDSLMDGQDIVYNLSRENFEKIVAPVLQKFENLCKNSIQKAINMKVNINNLHSVEMVGDTLRTPIINSIIKKIFNRELSKTLVPDECIARGCALFSMMNSPYYAIKNFAFQQYNPYLIQIEYPSINQYGQEINICSNLFFEGENIPSSKALTLNRMQLPVKKNILIKISYFNNDPNLFFLPNKLINSYNIYLPIEKQTDWTLNLIFTIDINCIPQLVKVTIKEKSAMLIPINPKANNNKNNNNNINNMNTNNINQNNIPNNTNQQFREEIREIETPIKAELYQINFGTPNNILKQYIDREKMQNNEDITIHEAISYKNSLEQYIYDTRDKLEENGQLKEYCTEQEKKNLNIKMDELMNWLYNDEQKEDLYDKKKLEEKSKGMKQIGDKIYKRYNEWNKLNEKYKRLESIINDTIEYTSYVEMDIKNGKKTNLKEEDIGKIKDLVKNTFVKISAKKNLTDKKDYKNLPPVFPDEIDMIINEFNDCVNHIKSEAKEKIQKEIKEEKIKNQSKKKDKDIKEKNGKK